MEHCASCGKDADCAITHGRKKYCGYCLRAKLAEAKATIWQMQMELDTINRRTASLHSLIVDITG